MVRISVIAFLCIAASCRSKNVRLGFDSHGFDKQVIEKLPVYDSLANVLVANYPSVHEHSEDGTTYTYIFSSDSSYLYNKLPQQEALKVKKYSSQLGADFFYGFALYKDSTIKIVIRDYYSKPYRLMIRERLSFYPAGNNIGRREYPVKDTVLNRNWQYWILFDEPDLFE